MCSSIAACCLALALLGTASMLQGCGGGGSGGDETTTTTVTTTTTTTTTIVTTTTTTLTEFARSPPMSVEDAVKYLNQEYMAYDFVHPERNTSLGLTISFAGVKDDFTKNLYCHPYTHTGCHIGFADCRMSCSLFNWKMISDNYIWATTFDRPTGYVFNQTMVESTLAKCSYLFDGATENRLNNGCGTGAGSDCSQPNSAYANICPSTKKVCTGMDGEVQGSLCKPYGPVPFPIAGDKGYQCFFSGPALNYPKRDQPNHLRGMVNIRMALELNYSDYADHNEVILDERELIPALWRDPALVIPAFLYTQSKGDRAAAEKMSERFSATYQVARVPVVGLNDVSSFMPSGPFFAPPKVTDAEMEAMLNTPDQNDAVVV